MMNTENTRRALRTELVFILDRSGSMSGLESDTIGGYNSLLNKQKKEDGECCLTTVLFDDEYELLHDRVNLKDVSSITDREYWVRGGTALLDAIGRTISRMAASQERTLPHLRADRILIVITTDGMENSSCEYGVSRIREMIEEKKKLGWEFLFLGANIDAVSTAARFGIQSDRAVNYHADSQGTQLNYEVLSEAVSCMRSGQTLDPAWAAPIQKDYRTRGGKPHARRNHR